MTPLTPGVSVVEREPTATLPSHLRGEKEGDTLPLPSPFSTACLTVKGRFDFAQLKMAGTRLLGLDGKGGGRDMVRGGRE